MASRNIQKRHGRYRARYRDDAGKEHARHFDLKRDAERWLNEVTASQLTGQYVDPHAGKVTLEQFFEQWSTRQVWTAGTKKAMRLAVRSAPFHNVPLRSIHRSHVERWVKVMRDGDPNRQSPRTLATGTIHTRVNNVRAVLRAAVRDRLIPSDPSQGVVLPRQRKPEAALTLPTSEQVGALLEAAETPFRTFIALCAFTGLRLGEAAAVQVGDVDFLGRSLTVSRQVQRSGGGEVEIRAPKYGSERVVTLPDELLVLLSAHVATLPAGGGDRWLFHGDGNDPPHQNTVGYWWRKTKREVGITGLKLHDLRHYYASGLIAAGCDVVMVQRALGHSKASTTLDTYSHLWPTAEDRTRRAAAGLIEQAADFADCVRTGNDHVDSHRRSQA